MLHRPLGLSALTSEHREFAVPSEKASQSSILYTEKRRERRENQRNFILEEVDEWELAHGVIGVAL